jgi:hypothetical protein
VKLPLSTALRSLFPTDLPSNYDGVSRPRDGKHGAAPLLGAALAYVAICAAAVVLSITISAIFF